MLDWRNRRTRLKLAAVLIVLFTATDALMKVVETLSPDQEHWLIMGFLLLAVVGPIPYLYWRDNLPTRLLAILLPFVGLRPYQDWKMAGWFARVDLGLLLVQPLFLFTAGVVVGLAILHIAISAFVMARPTHEEAAAQFRAERISFFYAMFILILPILFAVWASAGEAAIAVVFLTASAGLFFQLLYARDDPGRGSPPRQARYLHAGAGVLLLAAEALPAIFLAPLSLGYFAVVQIRAVRARIAGSGVLSVGVGGCLLSALWSLLSDPAPQGSDHFAFLYGTLLLAGSMSVFIARRWVRTLSDNVHKTRELEEARRLQLSMLPKELPLAPSVEVAWHMETATEVGGDYYDYSLSGDGTLTLALGDATGHGMNSGIVVTGVKSLFQTFADAPSITDSLTVMSKSLKGMNLPRMGMAMILMRIEHSTCTVSSAGMPPVMVYRAVTGAVEEIEIAGFPLGLSKTATYDQKRFEISPGDVILMISDGLPERLNPREEYFGYDRTRMLFAASASGTAEEICKALLRGGEDWAEGRPRDDDLTLVALKAKTPAADAAVQI